MTPEQHREKAERIERSMALLTDTDWEIRIEAAMLAGTHWANFALHRRGVSKESKESKDIIHTSMCVVEQLRKYKLAEPELLDWLDEIEELRAPFVRGDMEGGVQAGHRALALLRAIGERARQLA